MLTIAVFPNINKENADMVLRRIFNFYEHKQVRLLLPKVAADFFGYEKYGVENLENYSIDMGLSIGGDGTLLGVCRKLYEQDIPVCGINIGTFGFLADIELPELESKLGLILEGNYRIEERMMLAGFVRSQGKEQLLGHAINDVVVSKSGVARMLHLGLSISGCQVTDYKADGFIVSTATGSTAYSLSAGGPILHPAIKALLLTPICPHTFNVRPMVVGDEEEVCIHIAAVHQDIMVTFDGQKSFKILPGDIIVVRKAIHPAKIVKFEDKNYYQTVRSKLWRSS